MEKNDNEINWQQTTINLAGLALQGMLERESSWTSKLVSDALYKKLAKHAVSLAVACVDELKKVV